jgi:hypothetical protein
MKLPGPWRRLYRNRQMFLVMIALAALGIAASGMAQATDVQVTGAVSSNWRGAYDILVTPAASNTSRLAAATSGMIEPDFITYQGRAGLSFTTLDEIRATKGIAVAAPLSFLGYLSSNAVTPDIFVGAKSLPSHPTTYKMTLQLTTSDGLHTLALQTESLEALLGPANLTGARVPFLTTTGDFTYGAAGVDLQLSPLPAQVSPVEAVDPAAERQLLGPSAEFLSKLEISQKESTATTFQPKLIPDAFGLAQADLQNLRSTPGQETPVLPILVADNLPYPLHLKLTVQQMGAPLAHYPSSALSGRLGALAQIVKDQGSTLKLVGSTSLDLTKRLRAYEPTSFTILWPGSTPPNGTIYNTDTSSELSRQLASRAAYRTEADAKLPSFRVVPRGLVSMDGGPCAGDDCVESYRSFTSQSVTTPKTSSGSSSGGEGGGEPYFFAPVGSFNLGELHLPDNPVDHVPLGAYENSAATVLNARGNVTSRVVHPTENPLGFLTGPPDVITNLAAARLLRGADAIDAVRVRVSGVRGFSPGSERKIEQVASAIASLGGVHVQIVAGSSPRAVDVYVPRYNPNGSALGWVREEWTTLGAAEKSFAALSHGEQVLLILIGLLAAVLVAGAFVADVDAKRKGVRVWQSLGWSRRRQSWWLTSDAVLAAAVIIAASVAAELLFGRTLDTAFVGVGFGLVLVVAGFGTGSLLLHRYRRESFDPPSGRGTLTSWLSPRTSMTYAIAMIVRDSGLFVATTIAGVLSGVALLFLTSSLHSASERAGSTLLAADLVHGLRWIHLVTLVAVVVVSGISIVLFERTTLERRRPDLRGLSAVGWARSDLDHELLIERVIVALIIVGLTLLGAYLLGADHGLAAWECLLLALVPGLLLVLGGSVVSRTFVREAVIP